MENGGNNMMQFREFTSEQRGSLDTPVADALKFKETMERAESTVKKLRSYAEIVAKRSKAEALEYEKKAKRIEAGMEKLKKDLKASAPPYKHRQAVERFSAMVKLIENL